MGRNLNQVILGELENLEKDPDTRRAAMKALISYVKDLDSKSIPIFLARASEIKDPSSSTGECMISLFEDLIRSQGRNIIPHINNIMNTIIKTLSSNTGCFALHQACSKLVPVIARYGIDPLMIETEKERIISSLSKPLSNLLMSLQESSASGAALCLRALVESNNWRFATDATVNEICLKVAGALEETQTQTTSHMALVMALLKQNSLIVDAYARSLVRSGLQILTENVKEKNSQKRLSATHMINFLMKRVDSRSLSSEFDKIVDVMEKSQNVQDQLPFVKGAAFEAWQTAKIISGQKGSLHEMCSSPIVGSNSKFVKISAGDTDSHAEFSSDEIKNLDSFDDNDPIIGSPLSLGQSSSNVDRDRHTTRRLWNNGMGDSDESPENGCRRRSVSSSNSSIDDFAGFKNGKLSPQRSRSQLFDNENTDSTPQKLYGSLLTCSNANFKDYEREHVMVLTSPASVEVEWNNPTVIPNKENNSHVLNREVGARVKASTEETVQPVKAQRRRYGIAILCFLMVFIAVFLSVVRIDNDELLFSDVVPT